MALRVKKIRRHHDDGRLVIEQTRDLARVAALLEAIGIPATGLDRPGRCYVTACVGVRPIGTAGVETSVDVAVLTMLAVSVEQRQQGVGTALLAAARSAAHARGARELYVVAPPDLAGFFERRGFTAMAAREPAALAGRFLAEHLPSNPAANHACVVWMLDISRDGLVMR